jgi:anti-anti-sigma factor
LLEQKQVSREEVALAVTGPLSGETTVEFCTQMERLIAGSSVSISLDLSQAESISSSALGKILLFRKKMAEQRRTFRIRGCSDNLYSIFQMINFDSLIPIER